MKGREIVQIMPISMTNRYGNYKTLNGVCFRSNESQVIETVQYAVGILTTKEAKKHLNSLEGKTFVRNLFYNTSVKDLKTVAILAKSFKEKKEVNRQFREMVERLAKNGENRTFFEYSSGVYFTSNTPPTVEDIQSAIKLLTSQEANRYLDTGGGMTFVEDLFHEISVKNLEAIDILAKLFEEKKEVNRQFREMVERLAKNGENRTFYE